MAGGKPTRTAGASPHRRVRWRHPWSRQRDDEAVMVTTKLAADVGIVNDAHMCTRAAGNTCQGRTRLPMFVTLW
jgi:hypothetical protein